MKGTARCWKCSGKQQEPVYRDIEEITVQERTLDFKLSCGHTVSLLAVRTPLWEIGSKGKEASSNQNPKKRGKLSQIHDNRQTKMGWST